MKTRIKVTEKMTPTGIVTLYQAQVKLSFFCGWEQAYNHVTPYQHQIEKQSDMRGTLAYSQKVIDILLQEKAQLDLYAAWAKSKKVTYIKYP